MSDLALKTYANGAGYALLWRGRMVASAVSLEGGGCVVNLNGEAHAHAGEVREVLLNEVYARSLRELDAVKREVDEATGRRLIADARRRSEGAIQPPLCCEESQHIFAFNIL